VRPEAVIVEKNKIDELPWNPADLREEPPKTDAKEKGKPDAGTAPKRK
jgi:hypothetical protein